MRRLGAGEDETRPITSKDRAETFEESDVSIDGEFLVDGSLSMGGGTEESTEVYSLGSGNDNITGTHGLVINSNNRVVSVSGTIAPEATPNRAEVRRLDDNTLIDETSISSGSFSFTGLSLQAGTDYIIGTDSDGSGHDRQYSSFSFPLEYGSFDVVAGYFEDGLSDFDRIANIDQLTLQFETYNLSGTVEWPQPEDVYRWDAATFQTSPDGETVEVYVEESTDGGSTWTEIQGPISRGDQINADPGSRVRFRVELARSDTSNNPTLDAIYRRWVV